VKAESALCEPFYPLSRNKIVIGFYANDRVKVGSPALCNFSTNSQLLDSRRSPARKPPSRAASRHKSPLAGTKRDGNQEHEFPRVRPTKNLQRIGLGNEGNE